MSRREARAVAGKDLSESQVLAIERIADALYGALTDLDRSISRAESKPKSSAFDGRANQTFFVSGEPGAGKTSVHLTLRQFLDEGVPKDPEDRFPCTKRLTEPPKRIVWLEPLDLESVGESTNFLAAVLVRISAMMEGQGSEDSGQRRPSLLEPEPLQELYRIQNDLLLAWDGIHPQRAPLVDPEILAQEALRAEKARFQVNERLEKVLRKFSKASPPSKLFVLPVDDFHLKPSASLAFLRLLRMISVPELFVIVTGDLHVINELLYQNRLGLLVKLANETLQAGTPDTAGLTARAGALTSQSLYKLIPLSQRTVLEFVDDLQALDFVPEHDAGKQKLDKLEKLLAEVELGDTDEMSVVYRHKPDSADEESFPTSLRTFLLVRDPAEPDDTGARTPPRPIHLQRTRHSRPPSTGHCRPLAQPRSTPRPAEAPRQTVCRRQAA